MKDSETKTVTWRERFIMSEKKYSEEKSGEIVRQYEEGASPGQLEKIHGIHHRTIEGWII